MDWEGIKCLVSQWVMVNIDLARKVESTNQKQPEKDPMQLTVLVSITQLMMGSFLRNERGDLE